MRDDLKIIKDNGHKVDFDAAKIENAIRRADVHSKLSQDDMNLIIDSIKDTIPNTVDEFAVKDMHNLVRTVLQRLSSQAHPHYYDISVKYNHYRAFKIEQSKRLNNIMSIITTDFDADNAVNKIQRHEDIISSKKESIAKHYSGNIPAKVIDSLVIDSLLRDNAHETLVYFIYDYGTV